MQAMEVAFPGLAPAEPGPELAEHRRADPDAVASPPFGLHAPRIPLRSWLKSWAGPVSSRNRLNPGLLPPSACERPRCCSGGTPPRNARDRRCSSGLSSIGSIRWIHQSQSASASGSSLHSDSRMPILPRESGVTSTSTSVPSGSSSGAITSIRPPWTMALTVLMMPLPISRTPAPVDVLPYPMGAWRVPRRAGRSRLAGPSRRSRLPSPCYPRSGPSGRVGPSDARRRDGESEGRQHSIAWGVRCG